MSGKRIYHDLRPEARTLRDGQAMSRAPGRERGVSLGS